MPKAWIDDAPQPMVLQEHSHLKDPLSYKIKKAFLGKPLNRHTLSHQRLSKVFALGILSSDNISSAAYGTENMLFYLLPAFGMAGFSILMPMTFVVLAVLIIVLLNYREVVMTYTKTGGSYVVARDNFGVVVAQVAAVALMLDYIVTVAVQTAAGTSALTSAFPSFAPYTLAITLGVIGILAYGNLKGVKEAGRLFAAPTYLFIISVSAIIVVGIWRELHHTLHRAIIHSGAVGFGHSQQLITFASIFVLLKAFANGGSSLTGLEAISNSVSLFKSPEGKNARRTTVITATILGCGVLGISFFAKTLHPVPYLSGTPTVISQIAAVVFGQGAIGHIFYLFVQFSTMLILYTGANTPFSGFPFLMNFIAEDGFLPRQLTKRGHRLVFSNGIIFLTITSATLIAVVGSNVVKLIAFYAIGVFTGFTMAGFGMARRNWTRREKGWRHRFFINFLSGTVSFIVVVIFAVVKFTDGAWLIVLIFPLATIALIRLNRQYRREQQALKINQESSRAMNISRHDATVLVDEVDIATVGAVRYARSLNPHALAAVHFVIDDQRAEVIKEAWRNNAALADVSIEFIDCPDRRLANAAVDYAIRITQSPDVELTLLLPRRAYSGLLGRLLHDRTAEAISAPISQLPRVVATIVPFDVEKIISGRPIYAHQKNATHLAASTEVRPQVRRLEDTPIANEERSHYAEDVHPIAAAEWRHRAHIRGHVTTIRNPPANSTPHVDIEVWDETGGITLQFIGRREITGLDVGSTICAEGMVGETDGNLVILNPSYEIILN